MRSWTLALALPLLLGGCLSYTDNTPPRTETVVVPQRQTVVVPSTTSTTTTVVCSNGLTPPC